MAETPKYQVIKKQDGFEIRSYGGYIQAEVTVPASSYRSATERGFSMLADFIFGNNISKQKIAMTSPVTASQSQKIAMTTPVTVRQGEKFTVAFIMPAEFSMETLPQPRNDAISIRQIPAHSVAASRFTGYFNTTTIASHKQLLADWIEQQGLSTEGDFIVAGYNPPWVPAFLARNEVWIRLAPESMLIPNASPEDSLHDTH